MRIKEIEWSEHLKPDGVSSFYDYITGSHPLGEFRLEWKSWKKYDDIAIYLDGNFLRVEDNIEYAKKACHMYVYTVVSNCFE